MTRRILIEALITTQVLSHIQVNTKNPGVTFLGIWKFKRVGEAARCFSSSSNSSRRSLHTGLSAQFLIPKRSTGDSVSPSCTDTPSSGDRSPDKPPGKTHSFRSGCQRSLFFAEEQAGVELRQPQGRLRMSRVPP